MVMKIGVFVDVQNIYYTTREALGRPFNYRAFWQELSARGQITVANAYAIKRNDDSQIKFQDALRHIGFTVKLKPFIQRQDGSAKGDWDVGITIDIMEAAHDLDLLVLLSGDGDFAMLLQHIRQKHQLKSEVISVEALTADALIQASSQYTPIRSRWLQNQ